MPLLSALDWQDGRVTSDAMDALHASAEGGSDKAQLQLGHMLLLGHLIERDELRALFWFQQSAKQGNREALNMVGRCLELGWGAASQPGEAAHYYLAAAQRDHDFAQYNLAMLYFDGYGVEPDREQALLWFLRSARQRNAKSSHMVGRYCEEGWLMKAPRLRAAFRWYRRAAQGGDFRGQYEYGRILYASGLDELGLQWLSNSIETGIPVFCANVARDLENAADPRLREIAKRAKCRA